MFLVKLNRGSGKAGYHDSLRHTGLAALVHSPDRELSNIRVPEPKHALALVHVRRN